MRFAVLASVLLALMALSVQAQDRQEALCSDFSGRLPAAEVMAACTALATNTSFTNAYRARVYVWRAAAHSRADEMDAALADYDQALALDDDNYQARLARARIHLNRKNYGAALTDVNVAIREQPDYSAPVMLRSAIHLEMKRYDEAIADADNPRFFGGVAVLCQRCWARAVAGVELDKARIACDQALWSNPNNPAVLDSRALVFLKQKKFDLALADFDAILKGAPRNFRALYGRGVAIAGLGRQEEGGADITRAIAGNRDIAAIYAAQGIAP